MREILADLHIHTVLSACAEVEMIPPLIVRRALELGLALIAITDHNSAGNCAAVMEAAKGTGLSVLPGMEIQTLEDVHVLCLFETLEQALTWQGTIYDHLPDVVNPEEVLGPQFVVDATGGYLRTEERLLATSTDLALKEALQRVTALGGLAIPAHIDRPSFSLLANLGFVPPGLPVPALELFRLTDPVAAIRRYPDLKAWPLINNSDAHQLDSMAPHLRLAVAAPSLAEVALALSASAGRHYALATR